MRCDAVPGRYLFVFPAPILVAASEYQSEIRQNEARPHAMARFCMFACLHAPPPPPPGPLAVLPAWVAAGTSWTREDEWTIGGALGSAWSQLGA